MFILCWLLSPNVRRAIDLCRQVRRLAAAQRDLLASGALEELGAVAAELRSLCVARADKKVIETGIVELEKAANRLLQPYYHVVAKASFVFWPVTGRWGWGYR